MRVLLVATNRLATPCPVYPIGVDHVAAALGDRHEVRTVDLGASDGDDQLVAAIADFAPEIVGLSIRNVDDTDAATARSFIADVERVADVVRAHCPATIVLGGAGFSLFPEEILARVRADYGIVGEGEWLAGLLDALAARRPVDGVPGVVRPAAPAPEARLWPGPWSRRVPEASAADHYVRRGGMLNIQTKRGCPFRCSYCTYPLIEGRELRAFDPEQVADEWQALIDAGAKFLFVTDAVFNSDIGHNLALANVLARRNIRVPWAAFFAPVRPAPGYYAALREVGLTHVEFGTDALSPAMLQSYRKPFTPEDAIEAHAAARGAGPYVAHYLTLGGPGETLDTAGETLDRCEALTDASAIFFYCGVRIYPSTPVYESACRDGQVSRSESLLDPKFYLSPSAPPERLRALVEERARGRSNWLVGSMDADMARVIARLYARGAVGPLWERLPR